MYSLRDPVERKGQGQTKVEPTGRNAPPPVKLPESAPGWQVNSRGLFIRISPDSPACSFKISISLQRKGRPLSALRWQSKTCFPQHASWEAAFQDVLCGRTQQRSVLRTVQVRPILEPLILRLILLRVGVFSEQFLYLVLIPC